MKIKCIKPVLMDGIDKSTTVGKVYEVKREDKSGFAITDDLGQEHWFDPFGEKRTPEHIFHTEDYFILVGEALSCPFCGVVPSMVESEEFKGGAVYHFSEDCPLNADSFDLEVWNKRF